MPSIKQQPCCLASMCLWTMIMFESLLIFLFRGNHIWMFPHDISYDMVIAEQHSIFSSFCCRGNHIWIFPHDILHLVVIVEQSLNICFSFFCREAVESCENWSQSTTQQVDLAFNIFFMIYFFIRVSTSFDYSWGNLAVHDCSFVSFSAECCQWEGHNCKNISDHLQCLKHCGLVISHDNIGLSQHWIR